jgi:hypothetical protein
MCFSISFIFYVMHELTALLRQVFFWESKQSRLISFWSIEKNKMKSWIHFSETPNKKLIDICQIISDKKPADRQRLPLQFVFI